jgi:hypothetical protein
MAHKRKLEKGSEGPVRAFKRHQVDKPSHDITSDSEYNTCWTDTFRALGMAARGTVQSTSKSENYTPHITMLRVPEMPEAEAPNTPELEENFSGPSTSKHVEF